MLPQTWLPAAPSSLQLQQVGPQQRTEIYSRIEASRRVLKQQREKCAENAAQLADAEGGSGSEHAAAANGSTHPAGSGSDPYSAAEGSESDAESSGVSDSPNPAHRPHHLGCAELAADEEFAAAMSEVSC